MTWLIVNLQHCPIKNVIPVEKLVPVCAEQLNQLFNLFFNANLCDQTENWTALVQHWLLWNADWRLPLVKGRFLCSPCPLTWADWEMELSGERFWNFLLNLASWRVGTDTARTTWGECWWGCWFRDGAVSGLVRIEALLLLNWLLVLTVWGGGNTPSSGNGRATQYEVVCTFYAVFVSILSFSEQLTIKLLSFPAVRYK